MISDGSRNYWKRYAPQKARGTVIADLGSGLNYRKKGLNRLLELILHKRIRRLVLTHKDRLYGSVQS